MFIKKSIVLCLFSLLFVAVMAQQQKVAQTHTITLKDGTVYQGVIKQYIEGEKLLLQLGPNIIKTIKDKDIKKLVQDGAASPNPQSESIALSTPDKMYQFQEKGLYFESNAQLMLGSSAFFNLPQNGKRVNKIDPGIGAQLIGGYQINRFIGVGAGVGLDYYYLNSGETLLPVFADVRGYLLKSNVSPMYKLQAGYGFAFTDEDRNMLDAEGGFMWYPALGVRFGASESANFMLDFGVKVQKANYIFQASNAQTWWNIRDVRVQNDMIYRRFVVRTAILF